MTYSYNISYLLAENTLSLIEDIHIDGVGKLKAKTDTGNESNNVLHGTNVKIKGNRVSFNIGKRQISLPLIKTTKIHIGKGNIDNRPVVKCCCTVNGEKYKDVLFSIADRSKNNYKVLLGQPFIKRVGGMVDTRKID
jgi:hypothetical protein